MQQHHKGRWPGVVGSFNKRKKPGEEELPQQQIPKELTKYVWDKPGGWGVAVKDSWTQELKDYSKAFLDSIDQVAKVGNEARNEDGDEARTQDGSGEPLGSSKQWAKVQLLTKCFVCVKSLLEHNEHWNEFLGIMAHDGRNDVPDLTDAERRMNDDYSDLA